MVSAAAERADHLPLLTSDYVLDETVTLLVS